MIIFTTLEKWRKLEKRARQECTCCISFKYWKAMARFTVPRNLNLMYCNIAFKTLKFYKEFISSFGFLPSRNFTALFESQSLLQYYIQRAKLCFYSLYVSICSIMSAPILLVKSYANEYKQLRQQRFLHSDAITS